MEKPTATMEEMSMLLLQMIKILEMAKAVKLKKKINGEQPIKPCQIPASQQPQRSRITVRVDTFHTAAGAASASRHAGWENHTERAKKNALCACLPLIISSLARMVCRSSGST